MGTIISHETGFPDSIFLVTEKKLVTIQFWFIHDQPCGIEKKSLKFFILSSLLQYLPPV